MSLIQSRPRLLRHVCSSRRSASTTSWFPGHMSSSIRAIQNDYLQSVHVVVEVRDARLPFTSASTHLQPLIASKPRLIVLNKSDLTDLSQQERLQAMICTESQTDHVLVLSRNQHHHGTLLQAISNAADNQSKFRTTPRLIMVIGIPNVGKSSIIRALKHDKKSVQVGAKPGLTRAVSRIHLTAGRRSPGPDLYLLDTPGILPPKISSELEALKLSLVHSIPEHVVGNYRTGQYLQSILTGQYPTDAQFHDFLNDLARTRSLYSSSTYRLDLDRALRIYLDQFRQGKLGRFMLDLF